MSTFGRSEPPHSRWSQGSRKSRHAFQAQTLTLTLPPSNPKPYRYRRPPQPPTPPLTLLCRRPPNPRPMPPPLPIHPRHLAALLPRSPTTYLRAAQADATAPTPFDVAGRHHPYRHHHPTKPKHCASYATPATHARALIPTAIAPLAATPYSCALINLEPRPQPLLSSPYHRCRRPPQPLTPTRHLDPTPSLPLRSHQLLSSTGQPRPVLPATSSSYHHAPVPLLIAASNTHCATIVALVYANPATAPSPM